MNIENIDTFIMWLIIISVTVCVFVLFAALLIVTQATGTRLKFLEKKINKNQLEKELDEAVKAEDYRRASEIQKKLNDGRI